MARSQEIGKDYNWKAPSVVIDGYFSYLIPLQGLRGSGLADFFLLQNYGTVTGIAFNLDGKFALNKKRNLRTYISLGFAQANRDDSVCFLDSNTISRGYPLTDTLTYHAVLGGTSRLVIRDLYAALGFEYVFITKSAVMPFAGVEAALDYMYGYYVQLPNNTSIEKTFNINGGYRGGIGINIGTDIRMLNNVGVVFGAKYRIGNLIGKHSEKTTGTDAFDLLDQANTGLNQRLNSSRGIAYFQFYTGLSIFFGAK